MNNSPPTVNVLLFGITGHGKSTLGNMLLTGGTTGVFNVTDGMEGVTDTCEAQERNGWIVTDTVGLLEETTSVRKDPVTLITDFLKRNRGDYDHVLFVRRAGRVDCLDKQVWEAFLKIFQDKRGTTQDHGQYHGIVVVFTSATDDWLEREENTVRERYKEAGNRYIAVDFAPHSTDAGEENVRAQRRERDLAKLQQRLLGYRQAHGSRTFRPHYSDYTDPELRRFAWVLLRSILTFAGAGVLVPLMVYFPQLLPLFGRNLAAVAGSSVTLQLFKLFRALGSKRHSA